MNFLQWLFFVVAVVGLLWLGAIWLANAMVLPLPDPPMIGETPLPPLLFIGGLAVGLILSLLGRLFLNSGSKAVGRRVKKKLIKEIAPVTEEHMLSGIDKVLEDSRELGEISNRLTKVGRKK